MTARSNPPGLLTPRTVPDTFFPIGGSFRSGSRKGWRGGRPTITRGSGAAAVLAAAVFLAGAPFALAGLSGTAAASHTLSSATLGPASSLGATTGCGPVLSFSAKVDLSWTATPSAFASGHKVELWLGATLQSTTPVTPRTTVSLTQTGLATNTTYTWKVYAYFSGWTSPLVSASATTPLLCL